VVEHTSAGVTPASVEQKLPIDLGMIRERARYLVNTSALMSLNDLLAHVAELRGMVGLLAVEVEQAAEASPYTWLRDKALQHVRVARHRVRRDPGHDVHEAGKLVRSLGQTATLLTDHLDGFHMDAMDAQESEARS